MWLLPLLAILAGLPFAHLLTAYVPTRRTAPAPVDVPELRAAELILVPEPRTADGWPLLEPCAAGRTRVVLDEAYGCQHVDPCTPHDLKALL